MNNAGKTSYFAPPPYHSEEVEVHNKDIVDLSQGSDRKISEYFTKPPGANSFCQDLQVDDEDMPRKPTVLNFVYTGLKPVFLRMGVKKGKEESLKHKARELGVYLKKLNRVGLEKAIERYWIKQCGGYEEYLKADILWQEEQDISRNRIVRGEKRKRDFVEAHKSERKKRVRPRKSPLSNDVSPPSVWWYSVFFVSLTSDSFPCVKV